MNNTDKLLRVLLDALGFEIEEVESVELYRTIPFLGQTESDMLHFNDGCIVSRVQTDNNNHWELHRKVIDYKLTKKGVIPCVIDDWKDLTDCEKLMILKEEIKQLQEVPCEKT